MELKEIEFKKEILFVWIGFFAAIALFLVSLWYYYDTFPGSLSNNQDVWGNFGAYIGGLGGSIVALFALFLLLQTLITQKRELRETVKALNASKQEQGLQNNLSSLSIRSEITQSRLNFLNGRLSFQQDRLLALTKADHNNKVYDFDGESMKVGDAQWKKRTGELLRQINFNVDKCDGHLKQLAAIETGVVSLMKQRKST